MFMYEVPISVHPPTEFRRTPGRRSKNDDELSEDKLYRKDNSSQRVAVCLLFLITQHEVKEREKMIREHEMSITPMIT